MAEDHREIEAATRAEMERFAGSLRKELNEGLASMKADTQGWLNETKESFEQAASDMTACLGQNLERYESHQDQYENRASQLASKIEQLETRQKRAPLWTALLVVLGLGTGLVVIAVATEWQWREINDLAMKTTALRKQDEATRETLASTVTDLKAAEAELGKLTTKRREALAALGATKGELRNMGVELKKYPQGWFVILPKGVDLSRWTCSGDDEEKPCVKLLD